MQEHLWDCVRDFSLNRDDLVYRLTLPLSRLPEAITALSERNSGDAPAQIIADAASGTLWLSAAAGKANVEWFTNLISFAQERGGHAIIFTAPPRLKENLDVWGAPPSTLPLMRETKRQFDPKGLLNPGRFVAGL